jgi:hypothetical protein
MFARFCLQRHQQRSCSPIKAKISICNNASVGIGLGLGEGVVLVGEYAAATATDVAFEVRPAADVMDSAAGLQAMEVDTAPGASPPGASDGVAPPGTPGDSNVAPGEAHGLPLELLRQPPGECEPAVKVCICTHM